MANRILVKNGKVLTEDKKVLVAELNIPEGELNITENGSYDVKSYGKVNVEVEYLDLYQKRFNEYNGYGLFTYYRGSTLDEYMNILDLEGLNTCQYMFTSASNLKAINNLDTKDVTTMYSMCNGCSELESVCPLNTDKCDTFYNSFAVCRKLKIIDLSSLDKATNTSSTNNLASNCNSLTKFIIRKMTKIPTLNANAFDNCYHFTGTYHKTYNPNSLKDGRIYIPDEWVEQIKQATNWSTYADIIVPLSTLVEE